MIRPEFDVHILSEGGKVKAREIAATFSGLLTALEHPDLCGKDGRDMAIVRTKLEEACFFAKRGMAAQKANQSIGSA